MSTLEQISEQLTAQAIALTAQGLAIAAIQTAIQNITASNDTQVLAAIADLKTEVVTNVEGIATAPTPVADATPVAESSPSA